MPRKRFPVPGYLFHKPTGQARVRIDGRDFYLGEYGSDESRRRYGELVAKTSGGRSVDPFQPTRHYHETTTIPAAEADTGPTIAEVCLTFTRHADRHYRKRGKITSEVWAFRSIIDILTDLFGLHPAAHFGPSCLKTCRSRMIELGWCRSSVNRGVGRIRHIFKFAVENELVSPTILAGLKAVAPLLSGRTEAREADPVKPVADKIVDATIPHLPPIVADMVRVQRLTGMRPGEVCRMLWEEIDSTGTVWLYRPADHKLVHKGINRIVAIGPAAQAILLKRRQLVGPVFPGQHGAFTEAAYRRAITRACELAFGMPDELRNANRKPTKAELDDPNYCPLTPAEKERLILKVAKWRETHCWAPNRLRHAFATEVRKSSGLDAAAAALGHRKVSTTEVYAELDVDKAVAIAAKCG